MIAKRLLPAILLLVIYSTAIRGDDAVPRISPDDLPHLLATIKPLKGESPWREIPWLTNVTDARRTALAEDKPLVIFTAADGSPLSRTWGACTSNRARWFTGTQVEPEYVAKHFVPLALDTYFRGNSHELEFCQKVRAGGNHLVVATAGGQTLGKEGLKLRKSDLQPVLEEYARLPREQRLPALDDPAKAQPPKRPVPAPPPNGLIIRGYCTYLRQDEKNQVVRSQEYYYKQNPDRCLAETQSDMLWLTEAEWKSLIPANPKPGDCSEVASAIQKRFYSTIGIDYMEGSVNSLSPRKTTMTLTVEREDDERIVFRLDGYAHLGKEFDEKLRSEPNSRGCELRVLGDVRYDRKKHAIERFDVAGAGRAWGNKMDYIRREIKLEQYPWTYGIAWELVTGDTPQDRIPPYNLLHYNSTGPYFEKR